jgi:hypothetical protein
MQLHQLVRSRAAVLDPVLEASLPPLRIVTIPTKPPPSPPPPSSFRQQHSSRAHADPAHLLFQTNNNSHNNSSSSASFIPRQQLHQQQQQHERLLKREDEDPWEAILSSSDDEDWQKDIEREKNIRQQALAVKEGTAGTTYPLATNDGVVDIIVTADTNTEENGDDVGALEGQDAMTATPVSVLPAITTTTNNNNSNSDDQPRQEGDEDGYEQQEQHQPSSPVVVEEVTNTSNEVMRKRSQYVSPKAIAALLELLQACMGASTSREAADILKSNMRSASINVEKLSSNKMSFSSASSSSSSVNALALGSSKSALSGTLQLQQQQQQQLLQHIQQQLEKIIKIRWYDARARTALHLMAVWLQVPWQKIVNLEMLLSGESCPIGGGRPHQMERETELQGERNWRYFKVGAAAAVGGTLLGLTGGLAAPAIAAGLGSVLGVLPGAAAAAGTVSGFVASSAGVAALASAGTAAGAGVAGGGMARRTADVSEFGFAEIPENYGAGLGGGMRKMQLDNSSRRPSSSNDNNDTDENGEDDGSTAAAAAAAQELVLFVTLPPPLRRSAAAGSIAIGVSGWIGTKEDYTKPWGCLKMPGVDAYGLVWESKEMLALGNALGKLVARQAATSSANLALQHFFYAGVGLVTALAPSVLLGVGLSLAIENSWAVAMERSVKAGKLLAQLLAAGGAGDRPVVLVGHSMGARVVFHCLLELCRLGARGIVQDAVMLGTPVGIVPERWRMVRRVVSGRLINGYSRSDWLLGVVHGGSSGWMKPSAGLCPVPEAAPGVENVNWGSLAKGHGDYLEHLPDIIDSLALFS